MTPPRYRSVVLDVDSTLAGIEGIDWLAARRGAAAVRAVAALTDRAMAGEIALEAVYGERLALVRPSRADVAALADAYVTALAPGAAEAIAQLRAAGVELGVVSGGLRDAILPLAVRLGIPAARVRAVELRFDASGAYADYERDSPLATQQGKHAAVASLALPTPVLGVGDGATDLAMRPAVAAVAAFTGFVRREPVVQGADFVLDSFAGLVRHVLDPAPDA